MLILTAVSCVKRFVLFVSNDPDPIKTVCQNVDSYRGFVCQTVCFDVYQSRSKDRNVAEFMIIVYNCEIIHGSVCRLLNSFDTFDTNKIINNITRKS